MTPDNMELSTQLVNFFASLLLMVPMYFLGRQFFDRQISFWGTLLFQYLPISAQLLSDGISEPMYLVLLVSGLLQAVCAIRDRQMGRCALCGLFAGLAFLFGGPERLRSAMAAWYQANAGRLVTTDGLAAHLKAWSGIDVGPWWARYVHGRE